MPEKRKPSQENGNWPDTNDYSPLNPMNDKRAVEFTQDQGESNWKTDDTYLRHLAGSEEAVNDLKEMLSQAKAARDEQRQQPADETYCKLVLPHIGLVLLCVLYTLAGATVFYLVERPNEIFVRSNQVNKINSLKSNILEEMWNLSKSTAVSQDAFQLIAEDHLDNLTRTLFDAFEERYVTIQNIQGGNSTPKEHCIFFAATTITTIGYGNLVPVTVQGRIICVFFGLFGVPLMLVTIADMGKFISDGLVWCYGKYRKLKMKLRLKTSKQEDRAKLREELRQKELMQMTIDDEVPEDENIPVTLILFIIVGYTTLGGLLIRVWEDWEFFDSFYFSFITMTTIGFGDFVPVKESYYFFTLMYIVLGLAITTMCVDLVGSHYIEKIHFFGRRLRSARDALRTMGEVMRYAAFLRKKYGLSDEQLKNLNLLPDAAEWQEYMHHCSAFVPRDIHRIYYIDQSLVNSVRDSIRTSTMREGSKIDENSLASRIYV